MAWSRISRSKLALNAILKHNVHKNPTPPYTTNRSTFSSKPITITSLPQLGRYINTTTQTPTISSTMPVSVIRRFSSGINICIPSPNSRTRIHEHYTNAVGLIKHKLYGDLALRFVSKTIDRVMTIILELGIPICYTLVHCRLETVPYTKRRRLILVSKWSNMLEHCCCCLKIKPAEQPESVRVTMIFKNLIQALYRETNSESKNQLSRRYLKGLHWEIFVVDDEDDPDSSFCTSRGRIFVFASDIKTLNSDAEIATIIAHEIAHVVARHAAERFSKALWFNFIQTVLLLFTKRPAAKAIVEFCLELPCSRRREIEADYIGMLLMASAGYDPRVAPKVHEKIEYPRVSREYFCTHPAGKTRAKLLSREKVMKEAMSRHGDLSREVQV